MPSNARSKRRRASTCSQPPSIYSGPRFAGKDAWGNDYQLLAFQFRVDRWTGSLVKETDETVDAGFFSEDELPDAYEHYRFEQYREAFEDLERFSGEVILK